MLSDLFQISVFNLEFKVLNEKKEIESKFKLKTFTTGFFLIINTVKFLEKITWYPH